MLGPNKRAVFKVQADYAEVGVCFLILTTRPAAAFQDPGHAVGLIGDNFYVCLPRNGSLEVDTQVLCCIFSIHDVSY